MADLKPIENYIPVEWKNYLPPSIDQNNLNHLETNMKLNRDTINEIIRKLGVKPENVGTNADIYNNAIYETLIAHKNELARLERDKLNNSLYNQHLGDITKLQGGNNLVDAINNRLRRDIDDSADHTYTFKKLILTDTGAESIRVSGGAKIEKNLQVAGITSSGKISVTHADGIETTKLKVNNAATFGGTLTATGKITGNGGMAITNGASVSGTLTVDNLVVTGNITVNGTSTLKGNVTANNTLTAKDLKATNSIVSDKTIKATTELLTDKNYLCLGNGSHKIWVQGALPSLGSGDVALLSQA